MGHRGRGTEEDQPAPSGEAPSLMSAITTHVLDTARGRPAEGVAVVLERELAGSWREIGRGVTDRDGRVKALLAPGTSLASGLYRLIFATGPYFATQQVAGF